jgi:hypothetical protein
MSQKEPDGQQMPAPVTSAEQHIMSEQHASPLTLQEAPSGIHAWVVVVLVVVVLVVVLVVVVLVVVLVVVVVGDEQV